jgi:hypothetical protein
LLISKLCPNFHWQQADFKREISIPSANFKEKFGGIFWNVNRPNGSVLFSQYLFKTLDSKTV